MKTHANEDDFSGAEEDPEEESVRSKSDNENDYAEMELDALEKEIVPELDSLAPTEKNSDEEDDESHSGSEEENKNKVEFFKK